MLFRSRRKGSEEPVTHAFWDTQPVPGLAEDTDGVRIFARAITTHTVRGTGPEASRAMLLTSDWRREVETRGWDSVVECARAFERARTAEGG